MSNVLRVIAPQFAENNALIDLDPSHYSLFSDSDNILIKEFARGITDLINDGSSQVITHNLGYPPHFLVYSEVSTGRYRVNNDFNIYSGTWSIDVSTTTLTILNRTGTNSLLARYFIFYDNIN